MKWLRAVVAEVQTNGLRYLAAEWVRGVANRIDPSEARRMEESEETLRELGWWAYDGQAWSSAQTMVRVALRRAHADESWQGALR